MSRVVAVIGESGTGKSTSLRNLPPKETFILAVANKDLPFKGWKKDFTQLSKENLKGNYLSSDSYEIIKKTINFIDRERSEIKFLVLDDFQYLMGNEYMRRAYEKGWDKFTELAEHAWGLVVELHLLRKDLTVFILSHSYTGDDGRTRFKTIGKMLEEKTSIDGMFTILLQTVYDGGYFFETQGHGRSTAKTPIDLFKDQRIPNDLYDVAKAIKTYYEE